MFYNVDSFGFWRDDRLEKTGYTTGLDTGNAWKFVPQAAYTLKLIIGNNLSKMNLHLTTKTSESVINVRANF